MNDFLRQPGFHDLIPWADPYICGLIEKLRREDDAAGDSDRCGEIGEMDAELPPPLGNEQDREPQWPIDWSPRNWYGR